MSSKVIKEATNENRQILSMTEYETDLTKSGRMYLVALRFSWSTKSETVIRNTLNGAESAYSKWEKMYAFCG